MDNRIKCDRRKSRFLGIFVLGLLLVAVMIAAPASPSFAVVVIHPPRTSASVGLEPYDAPVTFLNNWYCTGVGLDEERETIELLWKAMRISAPGPKKLMVKDIKKFAKKYLDKEKLSADKFWGAPNIGEITLDPPQGGTVSHTWDHCYTMAELKAYKREAIRWAHYILDVYLPKNFPDYK